jgi:hypothetical protein
VVLVNKDRFLDVNLKTSYKLVIDVEDDYPEPLRANPQGVVYVLVTNINDAPEFTTADQNFQINENLVFTTCIDESSSSTVAPYVNYKTSNAMVHDPDNGNTAPFDSDLLYWSLTRNDDDAFQIAQDTGLICQTKTLDYELKKSYSIELKVEDGKELFDKNSYVIRVADVNDVPVLQAASLAVPENSGSSTTVGLVYALDEDAFAGLECALVGGRCLGAVTFSLVSGQTCPASEDGCFWAPDGTLAIEDNNDCNVNSVGKIECSATLRVADNTALNFEEHPTISLMVRATDKATTASDGSGTPPTALRRATAAEVHILRFDIAVTDVNELPAITSGQTFSIYENATISDIVEGGKIASSDPDNANGPAQSHFFNIDGVAGAFRIDSDGTLRANQELDFEVQTTYVVSVTVQDSGTPSLSDSRSVTINVKNVNEPPIVSKQTFNIDENTVSGWSKTIIATDPDAGHTATLTYELTDADGVVSLDKNFQISSAGVLTVWPTADLNYEQAALHTIHASVTDIGGLRTTVSITITINNINETPFLNHTTISCEKDAAIGTTVGRLVGTDPDANTDQPWRLTYTLKADNADGWFQLDPATGIVSVVKDASNSGTGQGVSPTTSSQIYSVTVTATDGMLESAIATITIVVQDENHRPNFGQADYILTIPEVVESLPYILDAGITTTDEDIETWIDGRVLQVLACALTMDDTSRLNPFQAISVQTETGASCRIEMNSNLGASAINFEDSAANHFPMTLEICDDGRTQQTVSGAVLPQKLCSTAALAINVTDVNEFPGITNSGVDRVISELASLTAAVVPAINAVDEDAVDQNLHYRWVLTSEGPSPFTLDPSDGSIAVSSALDYETISSYRYDVIVKDNNSPIPHEANSSVLITISNANEAPVYNPATVCAGSSYFTWSEGQSGPEGGFELNVADPDRVDQNGLYLPTNLAELSFRIEEGNEARLFSIEDHFIILNGTLDYEAKPVHNLTIIASDNGSPPLNTTFQVQVRAIDVNDLTLSACDKPDGSSCELRTRGGDAFVLTGTNFGFENAADEAVHGSKALNVTFGPNGDDFVATDCVIITRNTQIQCNSGPGVGGPLKWTVKYGDWVVTVNELAGAAYAAPYITALDGVKLMATEGQALITVTGENFGPDIREDTKSTLEIAGIEYDATECVITSPHTEMQCRAPAGVGSGIVFRVVAGAQTSNASAVFGSYKPPSITSVSTTALEYLAPADTQDTTCGETAITVAQSECYEAAIRLLPKGEVMGRTGLIVGNHMNLGSAEWQDIPPGCSLQSSGDWAAHYNHGSQGGGLGLYSLVCKSNTPYLRTRGGNEITITGENFGPANYNGVIYAATYGQLGDKYTATDCQLTVPQQQITCKSVPGVGANHVWVVSVQAQQSSTSTDTTQYSRPVITR